MASLNRATLLGQLGSDPDVRSFGDTRVALLSVATSTSWTDKANQKQEATQWHRVKAFGQQADFSEAYLGKGDTVLVEGSIETRSYEDKHGQKRYVTEIRAQRVQSVRSKGREEARSAEGPAGYSAAQPSRYVDTGTADAGDTPF